MSLRTSFNTTGIITVLATIILILCSLPREGFAQASNKHSIDYDFSINENGFVTVSIDFSSTEMAGSSWIFVPNSSNWNHKILSGNLRRYELLNVSEVADVVNPFYEAFKFYYQSSESFMMTIQFNMTIGAIIIEPKGMFFSPLIGFQEGNAGNAEVFLPKESKIVEAAALGTQIEYEPAKTDPDYAFFDLRKNILRLQIEFETGIREQELLTIKRGNFNFETSKRYENYASSILELFNTAYDQYTNLFNSTLGNINANFFIPEFNMILSVGGYVPFSPGRVGDIHINLFFARSVNGVLEIIALHELVHHFLLKAGISPDDLLWFHEGMAQYTSIQTAELLGYVEGASSERDRLESDISTLLQKTGGNLQFIQRWKPETQPRNIVDYYKASYYVINNLAEDRGKISYYESFFKLLNGAKINDNDVLSYYLSLAANVSIVPELKNLGFTVVDLYSSGVTVIETERAISNLNPIYQPDKLIAEHLYRRAITSLERGDLERANKYLETSLFIAKKAPVILLITLAMMLGTILYVSKKIGIFSSSLNSARLIKEQIWTSKSLALYVLFKALNSVCFSWFLAVAPLTTRTRPIKAAIPAYP